MTIEVSESELFLRYRDGDYLVCPMCRRDDCVEWDDIDPDGMCRPFYCSNCDLRFMELLEITGVALMEI